MSSIRASFFLALSVIAAALLGCGDPCCNACSRQYVLGSAVDLQTPIEGGNNCTIDDVPRGLPTGPSTVAGVVLDSGVGWAWVRPDLALSGDQRAHASCASADRFFDDPGALADEGESVEGARVCVVGDIEALTICTDEACAQGWF